MAKLLSLLLIFEIATYFLVYSCETFHYQDLKITQIPNAAETHAHTKPKYFDRQAFRVLTAAFFWI